MPQENGPVSPLPDLSSHMAEQIDVDAMDEEERSGLEELALDETGGEQPQVDGEAGTLQSVQEGSAASRTWMTLATGVVGLLLGALLGVVIPTHLLHMQTASRAAFQNVQPFPLKMRPPDGMAQPEATLNFRSPVDPGSVPRKYSRVPVAAAGAAASQQPVQGVPGSSSGNQMPFTGHQSAAASAALEVTNSGLTGPERAASKETSNFASELTDIEHRLADMGFKLGRIDQQEGRIAAIESFLRQAQAAALQTTRNGSETMEQELKGATSANARLRTDYANLLHYLGLTYRHGRLIKADASTNGDVIDTAEEPHRLALGRTTDNGWRLSGVVNDTAVLSGPQAESISVHAGSYVAGLGVVRTIDPERAQVTFENGTVVGR